MTDIPIPQRDAKIKAWLNAKDALAVAKDAEMALRNEVTEMLFENPTKGTQRYPLGNGYNVKLVYGTTYILGAERLPWQERATLVEAVQEKCDLLGNEGPALADRLFKWKPELDVSEYEKLDEAFPIQAAIKAHIDEILITKPASPQLDFEVPKVKK